MAPTPPDEIETRREELNTILKNIVGPENKVYFQPPSTITMSYPCIVYKRNYENTKHASNSLYSRRIRYQIQVIDRNPDSNLPNEVAKLPLCSFDRFFVTDNLNHDVYNLYF